MGFRSQFHWGACRPRHSRSRETLSDNIVGRQIGAGASEVRKIKRLPGKGIAILGSGPIVAQLEPLGLIDEYELVLNPVVVDRGHTLFEDVKDQINPRLTETRTFLSGNVLLCYEPTT